MRFLFLLLAYPLFSFEIKVAHSIADIDQPQGKTILVRSFMTEYEDVPLTQLSPDFHSTGDVRRFYENYFESKLECYKNGELIWVQAFEGNQLLGWATFELEPGAAYMNLLAVDPYTQRKGVGKALTFAILSKELHPELNEIRLLLRNVNEGGRMFYERIGFRDFVYERDDNFVDMNLLTGLKWIAR